MTPELTQAFESAAAVILKAWDGNTSGADEPTPPQLVESLRMLLAVCASLDQQSDQQIMDEHEAGEIAQDCILCVAALAAYAYRLRLTAEQRMIEGLALEFAGWAARHSGEIVELAPVVNALANKANDVHAPQALEALYAMTREIVEHVAHQHRPTLIEAGAGEPWNMLNLNFGIIATRTQRLELMNTAYDLLESNVPELCASFYEEGMRQAEKAIYAPHVREIIRARHAKWTTCH